MKSFYTANKVQVKFNNVITALEFLYPDLLASRTKNNSEHFSAWKYLEALCSLKLREFSVENFLEVVKDFERTYLVFKKADVLSCNYDKSEELISFCKENKYAILTENDFFYEKNEEFVSLNGNKISGEAILLVQS